MSQQGRVRFCRTENRDGLVKFTQSLPADLRNTDQKVRLLPT